MAWRFGELLERLWNFLIVEDGIVKAKEEDDLVEAVERARAEWLAAKAYFDHVTDPDLIEHAIYSIKASERKYTYLLKRAAELGYGPAAAPAGEAAEARPDAQAGADGLDDGVDPGESQVSESAHADQVDPKDAPAPTPPAALVEAGAGNPQGAA